MTVNRILRMVTSLTLWLTACSSTKIEVAESVMVPGSTIKATNAQGTLVIKAEEGFKRTYSTPHVQKTFQLFGRDKRWDGSLGMYRPFGDRDLHAVLQEVQQHFNTTEEALAWLERQKTWHDLRWTSDGLAVAWREQARPEDGFIMLSTEVWQIYIRGRKPKSFPWASDKSIVFHGAKPAEWAEYRLPAARTIDGVLFSGRALGLMQDFEIKPETVLATLRGGDVEPRGKGKYLSYSGYYLDPKIDCHLWTNRKGLVLFAEP